MDEHKVHRDALTFFFGGQRLQRFNQPLIVLAVFTGEAWKMGAKVAR
jgi:hypothetical protein